MGSIDHAKFIEQRVDIFYSNAPFGKQINHFSHYEKNCFLICQFPIEYYMSHNYFNLVFTTTSVKFDKFKKSNIYIELFNCILKF